MKSYRFSIRFILMIVLVITLLIGLAGCNNEGTQETQENNYIQIKGSDTEVNLVQRLAETYMEDSKVEISVTGGGSGTGISALINGQVDIANSSRVMKDEEIEQARNNNIDPVRLIIAMDGLSVIAHKSNPVSELTLKQIGDIFKGETKNWQELGGQDKNISLYGRQSNSGTYVYFRDTVLKGDYDSSMNRMNGNAQIVESVKADESSIGYVGVGYVTDENDQVTEGLKIIKVAKEEGAAAVDPLNPENIKTGAYPLARPLNQYVDGKPEGIIKDFIEFELGDKGQEIAVEEGFYPVSPEYTKINEEKFNQ